MKDPITEGGSEVGRALFKEFARTAHGKPVDDVLGASINMICNCLRQHYGLRSEVEPIMKELFGRAMEILLEHYDPVTGRRRSVIPFDQVIRPQTIIDETFFPGLGRKH